MTGFVIAPLNGIEKSRIPNVGTETIISVNWAECFLTTSCPDGTTDTHNGRTYKRYFWWQDPNCDNCGICWEITYCDFGNGGVAIRKVDVFPALCHGESSKAITNDFKFFEVISILSKSGKFDIDLDKLIVPIGFNDTDLFSKFNEFISKETITKAEFYQPKRDFKFDCSKYCNTPNKRNKFDINGTNLKDRINIFPNPSNGYLTMEYTSEVTSQVEVQIIDLLGKVIINTNWNIEKGLNKKNLTIESSGLYYISIKNENQEQYFKPIIIF